MTENQHAEEYPQNKQSNFNIKELNSLITNAKTYPEKIYAAAQWYGRNGFPTVPFLLIPQEKARAFPRGLSQHHATCDIAIIERWWNPNIGLYRDGQYAIAMAMGGKSGVCAIDLDCKDGNLDGLTMLNDLYEKHGDYDDGEGRDLNTLMQITPSGGRHLIYKHDPRIQNNAQKYYHNIDTRGCLKDKPDENGGIIFVAPSIKPIGEKDDPNRRNLKSYTWDENINEIITAPQWLINALTGSYKGNSPKEEGKKGKFELNDSYPQGERDSSIYNTFLRAIGHGYNESELTALVPEIIRRMSPPDDKIVLEKLKSALKSKVWEKSLEKREIKTRVKAIGGLTLDKNGNVTKHELNLIKILESEEFTTEYGLIEYDEFTQNFILNKESMTDQPSDWAVDIKLWIIRNYKVEFPKTNVADAVMSIVSARPHTNLAREYMFACHAKLADTTQPHDYWGSGRLGGGKAFHRLCTEVLDLDNPNLHHGYNEETKELYKAFLWFWLRGVVARACVPACKMEIFLNIFGGQGIGKSLFFNKLCPDSRWFTDQLTNSVISEQGYNKDDLSKLRGKNIVEMAELSPFKTKGRSASELLKQFISSQIDEYRSPYARDVTSKPRTFALCGTSNKLDVYRDSTGSRRFLSINHADVPIKVGDLNFGVMDEIREQVYAEVMNSFNVGELDRSANELCVYTPHALRLAQKETNDLYKYEDVGIDEVLDWAADKSRVTPAEFITFAKTIHGLRDEKESFIWQKLIPELRGLPNWKHVVGSYRMNEDGKKVKSRFWINTAVQAEKDFIANPTRGIPSHWSTYSTSIDPDADAMF